MKDFFKKIISHIKQLWGKWTFIQRIILIGIVAIVLIGLITLLSVSSSPTLVPVFDYPVTDQITLENIILRMNQEGVKTYVDSSGLVQVTDEATARRMRAILIREDLIPTGANPWQIFDTERWTLTDLERNVNWQRAQTQLVIDHIKAIDGVDNAHVSIVFPKDVLFISDQNPVTASVIITPSPGSDVTQNRKKIEGIQKILKFAVEGLKDEFITINDQNGIQLNNFEDIEGFDRLKLVERQQRQILQMETGYAATVLKTLQSTFSEDRVRDLNLKIEMDMSRVFEEAEEFYPIVEKPQTPGLSYDDSKTQMTVERSRSTSSSEFQGTGYIPEGPPGVEGQMPPSYRDIDNHYGNYKQETEVINNEINRKQITKETSPKIDRITVSVNIDGVWKKKYLENGDPDFEDDKITIKRDYIPIPEDVLRSTELLIQNAIGFDAAKNYNVSVHNIAFDRRKEFALDDAEYLRQQRMQLWIIVALSGVTLLLIAFIIFRVVSREMERRRRLAEEERLRREQAMRESAMAEAEQEGVDVSISLEERNRMELMESIVNMAKEHPDDCAQLLRTWILEE